MCFVVYACKFKLIISDISFCKLLPIFYMKIVVSSATKTGNLFSSLTRLKFLYNFNLKFDGNRKYEVNYELTLRIKYSI